MACADVDMDIVDDEQPPGAGRREAPPPPRLLQYYQATKMLPDEKGPLYNLIKKQPAVLGSLQMVSGLLSIAVGILFAATQDMKESLFTLFRVSQLSGVLFMFAGLVSNLLFKYPELLSVSLGVNCGSIVVAFVAASLISVDLANWESKNDDYLKMELMELCVLGFEVSLSAVLCVWFLKEKREKSQ